MKFAFYKGEGTAINGFIRWWMKGKYSHTECILDECYDSTLGQMVYTIASSVPGTGIRIAENQTLPADEWDILEIPGDPAVSRAWYERHIGATYDYIGLFGFVFRPFSKRSRNKYWCSQSNLRSVGFKGAWREDPNSMYNLIKYISKLSGIKTLA